jgi:hypothetical protein
MSVPFILFAALPFLLAAETTRDLAGALAVVAFFGAAGLTALGFLGAAASF